MSATKWSEKILDDKRQRGDLPADRAIEQIFGTGQTPAVNELLVTLVRNEELPAAGLPPPVLAYLAATSDVPAFDAEAIREGQKVFELYGPEVLMVLGLYAIPAAYAARRGVQVLYRTAYFEKRPMRRVWETTQFVVDVMTEGGLGPAGRGVRTAQKVRLMHAAIRHLLRQDPRRPWDAVGLGVPINQEDLAATLMEFSFVVLEGLDRLGIRLTRLEQEAYLHAWLAVGKLMGVDDDLRPANVDEARALTTLIAARQIEASDEGRKMTAALIAGMQETMPPFFGGFVASTMRFFLERDRLTGKDVADMLDVPRADWTTLLVEVAGTLAHLAGLAALEEPHFAAILRALKLHYIERLLRAERGPGRPAFRIPARMREVWRVGG